MPLPPRTSLLVVALLCIAVGSATVTIAVLKTPNDAVELMPVEPTIPVVNQNTIPTNEAATEPSPAARDDEATPAEPPAESAPEPVEDAAADKPLVTIQQDVPFTSQAPFGNWNDARQQDGCEEASVLMAAHWVAGTTFTPEQALEEILELSATGEDLFGYYQDTDVEDTARLLAEYYGITSYVVHHDVTLAQIQAAVQQGSVVLLPTDGQALGNPNFTSPGPERHMVVVIGYDALTSEFVTNDPGTRQGAGYRYDENTLFTAIRDYPSGDHRPITGHTRSAIVVSR